MCSQLSLAGLEEQVACVEAECAPQAGQVSRQRLGYLVLGAPGTSKQHVRQAAGDRMPLAARPELTDGAAPRTLDAAPPGGSTDRAFRLPGRHVLPMREDHGCQCL